jgi:hypothetical protein
MSINKILCSMVDSNGRELLSFFGPLEGRKEGRKKGR